MAAKKSTHTKHQKPMRTATLSTTFTHTALKPIQFGDETSILEYDLILFDPVRSHVNYEHQYLDGTYKGKPLLSNDGSFKFLEDFRRRAIEIREFLELGRIMICPTPEPQNVWVWTGRYEHSGTGRNRQTTRIVEEVDLLAIFPVAIKTIAAAGDSISFGGNNTAFKVFLADNTGSLSYRAYFKDEVGEPVLFLDKTSRSVALDISVGKGHLVFVPFVKASQEFVDNAAWQGAVSAFIVSIQSLAATITDQSEEAELPDWTNGYAADRERQCLASLIRDEAKAAALQRDVDAKKARLEEFRRPKRLFTTTGLALERIVAEVFRNWGIVVREPTGNRTDLIIEHHKRHAVIEIKGVTGSAAESHAAQLEKWVSEYITEHETIPKAILIVNAYRDKPIDERPDIVFPTQMLAYASKREQCLVSGFQLWALNEWCAGDQERIANVLDLLFSTIGILVTPKDVADMLAVNATTSASVRTLG